MAAMNRLLSTMLSVKAVLINTLAVADQYCKDALAALDAVRDFPGKEFLVMAVGEFS